MRLNQVTIITGLAVLSFVIFKEIFLTDVSILEHWAEVRNLEMFLSLVSISLPADTVLAIAKLPIENPMDVKMLNYLISLEFQEIDARFICNYFLSKGLPYEGNLLHLSTNLIANQQNLDLSQAEIPHLQCYTDFYDKNPHSIIIGGDRVRADYIFYKIIV